MSTESSFSAVVAIWAALALPALVFGLLEWDPVGRKGGKGLGPQINSRAAWTVIETPALLVFPLVYLLGANLHLVGNVLVGVWIAHYLHRTVIWPRIVVRKSSTASMSLVLAGGSFNVVNGLVLGWFMGHIASYPNDWLTDPRFVAGFILMLAGAGINIWSEYSLYFLRSRAGGGYILPRGGLFETVSCPNLLGEIVEWCGFALMSWSLPGLAFALWTIANLTPRAIWRHGWYLAQFPDYPKNRKALIPYVL